MFPRMNIVILSLPCTTSPNHNLSLIDEKRLDKGFYFDRRNFASVKPSQIIRIFVFTYVQQSLVLFD